MSELPKLKDTNALCTAQQLGAVLGKSVRQIHHLAAEGVLQTQAGGSRYKLADSVQLYLAYQRKFVTEQCRTQTAAYDSARTRRMAALAEAEELNLAIARGEMLRRSRVVLIVTTLLGAVKNHVLAIPSRCTRQIVGQRDAAKVRAILDSACRDTLREASEFGAHSFDEHGTNGSKKAAAAD
jgi:phage terminase Nu1 subunit (DNA packaging protein)